MWSLIILATCVYVAYLISYWVCLVGGVILFLMLYTLVSSISIPSPLCVANVGQDAVLILFQNNSNVIQFFWFQFDAWQVCQQFVSVKFFSFADLRIGYVYVYMYRSHLFAGVELLYDGVNVRSCVSTVFDKLSNIWFHWLDIDLTCCKIYSTNLASSDCFDITSSNCLLLICRLVNM